MNEQELQQAFAQYLVQVSGAQTEEQLKEYVNKLGKEGIQKLYQEFIAQYQQSQARMARHGAKLNYISKLQNLKCAEDEEITYFKVGGKVCKKCQKKKEELDKKGALPYTPMQKAETGTKLVQEFKMKCGGKAKKKSKGENGIKLNSTPKTTERNLQPYASMKCGGKSKMEKGASLIKKLNKKN